MRLTFSGITFTSRCSFTDMPATEEGRRVGVRKGGREEREGGRRKGGREGGRRKGGEGSRGRKGGERGRGRERGRKERVRIQCIDYLLYVYLVPCPYSIPSD